MERVGGTQRIKVDVRVLAATNKDLPCGDPRGPVPRGPLLQLERHPHLRARAPRSAARTSRCSPSTSWRCSPREYGRRPKRLAPEAAARLQQYALAGQRARTAECDRARDHHGERGHHHGPGSRVPGARRRARTCCRPQGAVVPLSDARDRFEKDYILQTLAAQQGNMSRTAEVLGVERSNLYKKLRAFGITPPGGRGA